MPGMSGMGDQQMMGSMMQGGGAAMCGMMMGNMKMSQHVDTRLNELRSAIGITRAQTGAWNSFAAALRSTAARMDEIHKTMMPLAGRMSAVDSLARHERMLTQAHAMLHDLQPSLGRLYGVLSPAQKAKADQLLVFPGMMMPHMPMAGMGSRP